MIQINIQGKKITEQLKSKAKMYPRKIISIIYDQLFIMKVYSWHYDIPTNNLLKWKSISKVLHNHRLPTRLKGKFIQQLLDQSCFMIQSVEQWKMTCR